MLAQLGGAASSGMWGSKGCGLQGATAAVQQARGARRAQQFGEGAAQALCPDVWVCVFACMCVSGACAYVACVNTCLAVIFAKWPM